MEVVMAGRFALRVALVVLVLGAVAQASADESRPFRADARALMECLRLQAVVSQGLSESPEAYAVRLNRACGTEIASVIATAATPPERRRVRGAVRGAVTDAVLAYDARMVFAGP